MTTRTNKRGQTIHEWAAEKSQRECDEMNDWIDATGGTQRSPEIDVNETVEINGVTLRQHQSWSVLPDADGIALVNTGIGQVARLSKIDFAELLASGKIEKCEE